MFESSSGVCQSQGNPLLDHVQLLSRLLQHRNLVPQPQGFASRIWALATATLNDTAEEVADFKAAIQDFAKEIDRYNTDMEVSSSNQLGPCRAISGYVCACFGCGQSSSPG